MDTFQLETIRIKSQIKPSQHFHTNSQADKQTDRWTGELMNGHPDEQTGAADKQTGKLTDRLTDRDFVLLCILDNSNNCKLRRIRYKTSYYHFA